MNVPADHISPITWFWTMREHKRTHQVRSVDTRYHEIRRRIAGAAIVIPAHEHNLQARVACSPFGKRFEHAARPSLECVEQIAEENDTHRGSTVDQML